MAFSKLFNYSDPQLDEELRRLIQELALQPAWIAPTFTNAWVNFGGVQAPVGYFKDQFGLVHIRGMMQNGVANAAAFTLPTGYRPVYEESFGVVGSAGADRIIVQQNGVVKTIATGGAGTWMSLAGISFRTV